MAKCQMRGAAHRFGERPEREWMMQPDGPDDKTIFTVPGSHYRGFPAIGVCDECKRAIEEHRADGFTFRMYGKTAEIMYI